MARILIVEDNDEFRTTVASYLKRQNLGTEIFEASTGEMAVTKASCIKPDIVIMDVHLPKANGFQTATVIQNDHPQCEVIVLTMFDIELFKKMGKDFNAANFIGKTDVYDRLVPVIKKCFERQKIPFKEN